MSFRLARLSALACLGTLALSAHANLLANGGFEATSSPTATPTGWVNIGHSDGVITYAAFGTPAYEGVNYYDLGGYGDAYGPVGDGIGQSFATMAGQTYTVSFGMSAENYAGTEELTVAAGGTSLDFWLTPDGSGTFQRAFVTQTFTFVATGASTFLSFIHSGGDSGNNDPMIDGVNVTLAGAVPEPAAPALMLAGLALVATVARRRRG